MRAFGGWMSKKEHGRFAAAQGAENQGPAPPRADEPMAEQSDQEVRAKVAEDARGGEMQTPPPVTVASQPLMTESETAISADVNRPPPARHAHERAVKAGCLRASRCGCCAAKPRTRTTRPRRHECRVDNLCPRSKEGAPAVLQATRKGRRG